jgi:mono/diheme cytochrome c family protein
MLCLIVIGITVVLFSGAYNVAASQEHTDAVSAILSRLKDQSIHRHSVPATPPDLKDKDLVTSGAVAYDEMCATCHGAPGREPSYIGKGLNPKPPELGQSVAEFTEEELFWILKHGIIMTGMPAFGATHTDEQLWSIVGFLTALPTIDSGQYTELVDAESDIGHAHSHDDQHENDSGSGQTSPSSALEVNGG